MANTDDQSKPESPSQIFCEQVTVAGLEDLYIAKFPPTRYMFAVGMVMVTIFGLFTSYHTVQNALDETTSVNIEFKDDGDMLFPNVTVCTSLLANLTFIKEILVVPKRVEEKLKEIGADRERFLDEIIQLVKMSSIINEVNRSFVQYIKAVFTATEVAFKNEGGSLFDTVRRVRPLCDFTLSNCTYDGNPIDCCDGTVPGYINGHICYGVPLSTVPRKSEPFSRPIMFNVDVRMDWADIPLLSGLDELDGFLVIVSQPSSPFNTAPVAVAPGWHGTIKLTRIRRRTDRTDCIPRNKLPKLDYYSYYDQDGKNCELELALDMFQRVLQCTTPLATHFPNSTEACSFQQTSIWWMAMVGAFDNIANVNDNVMNQKFAKRVMDSFRDKMGSPTKQCKPICQHWQYEPIVGYSELRDSHGRTTDINANISWSRITVSIPSEYYEEHMEEERSGLYVIMCNVGGAMGVCLGLSAVTLIQVVAYGLQSCYIYKRNRKRVQPS